MICAKGSAGIGIGMNVLFPEWKNFGKEDMLDAMHNLGINVICVEFEAIHDRVNPEAEAKLDALIEEYLNKGDDSDAVFTFNYSPLISNVCKKHNVKYVAWVYDSPLVSLFSYTIINPCNHVYVFDRALADRFASEGITTVHYMPLAANVRRLDAMNVSPSGNGRGLAPEAVKRVSGDIAFVGSMYNEKHQLYERLSSMPDFAKGYLDGIIEAQMKVQGYFFMEEMLKGPVLEEMKKALNYKPNRDGVETPEYVYANYFLARKLAERERRHLLGMLAEELPDSRVNLYTHNPTPELPGVHNVGAVDYYNDMPYVFKCSRINLNISLRSIQTGIPLRCMDIMGAGGFLMSNYQADLLEHFIPGEDFVYYESDEDLISKCRYYLEHDEERRAIAASGHIKVAAAHTYEDRVRQMFM